LTAGYRLPLEKSYPMQLEKLLRDAGYEYAVINGGSSGDTSA
jgi:lysophospholipase L1-like esterase